MRAKITGRPVQVMNTMWAPPMKRGFEITLLIIELAIRKSGPFCFFENPYERHKV
jgi:hypothetical protein